jgi:cytochrome c oxidase subunit 3
MELAINNQEIATSHRAKRFLVWLFVGSSTIMFGGWTSYYLVFMASKGKGHGLVLPDAFQYSTFILILSSLCLAFASKALRRGTQGRYRLLLWGTFVLGILFAFMQFRAWGGLYSSGAVLVNNNAAISMIYIISGVHLHIVGGLFMVSTALVGSYKQVAPEVLSFRQDITSIFWHFIDLLWVYLYVFLLLNS